MSGTAITTNFDVRAPKMIDNRYGVYHGVTKELAEQAALDAIPEAYRVLGLTVGLIFEEEFDLGGEEVLSENVVHEFWFRNNTSSLTLKITGVSTPTDLVANLNLNDPNTALNTQKVSEELTLNTNREIKRDFSNLNGQILNVNTSIAAIDNLAKMKTFIEKVFFPDINATLAIALDPSSTLREVGNTNDIDVIGIITPEDNDGTMTSPFVKKNEMDIGGALTIVDYQFSHLDTDAGRNINSSDVYQVGVTVKDVDTGDDLDLTANRTVEYIFPIIVGETLNPATDPATLTSANIHDLIGSGNAVKVLAKWVNGSTISVGSAAHNILANASRKFILTPVSLGRRINGYEHGTVENVSEGAVAGNFGSFEKYEDIDLDFAEWGAGSISYKMLCGEYSTEFEYNVILKMTSL